VPYFFAGIFLVRAARSERSFFFCLVRPPVLDFLLDLVMLPPAPVSFSCLHSVLVRRLCCRSSSRGSVLVESAASSSARFWRRLSVVCEGDCSWKSISLLSHRCKRSFFSVCCALVVGSCSSTPSVRRNMREVLVVR
jgi:hypothetical protein